LYYFSHFQINEVTLLLPKQIDVYKYVAIKLILAQIKLTLTEFLSRKDKH